MCSKHKYPHTCEDCDSIYSDDDWFPCDFFDKHDTVLKTPDGDLDSGFCYKMQKPELSNFGYYSNQNIEALELWGLISGDRNLTQGPTSIPTPSITDICRSFGATQGVFLKIKFIEHEYYTSLLKQHSEKLEEIKNKKTPTKSM